MLLPFTMQVSFAGPSWTWPAGRPSVAGIARVDFRTFFGYGVIFSALWFVLGVGILTFVP